MQFFLSELRGKNYRFQPCAFLKFRKISEITSPVEILFFVEQTLADLLCRILALSSFVENLQEGLQVQLKRTPLQMFPKVAGKFPKIIGAAYKNSKIFYNIFYTDAMRRLLNGSSFNLMKICYSKRYYSPPPSRPPYVFT